MDAIVAQVQALANNADEAGRLKLVDGLRDLSYSIESPRDSMHRLMYTVRPCIARGRCVAAAHI